MKCKPNVHINMRIAFSTLTRTGDTEWVKANVGAHEFFAEGLKTLRNNLIKCCAGTTLSVAIVLAVALSVNSRR